MGLERCGRCTAPIYVRLAAVWNDDGTITGRFAGHTRVVQIYAAEINHILSGIGERIGLDIGRLVVEGERKAAVEFTGEMTAIGHGLAGSVGRSRLFSRLVLTFVLRAVKNAGLGNGRITQYKRGERMTVEFSTPFNIPILVGEMLGAFEAFFRRPAEGDWEGDTHFAVVHIKASPSAAHVEEERLKPVLTPTIPGKVELQRCPRCGMPLAVTALYNFDLDAGIATEVTTGRRIVTVIIDSLNAVFKELESELGPEIPRMIVDLESDYIKDIAPGPEGPADEALLAKLLDDLKVKGMGNPVEISLSGDSLTVRIDNPFSEELLAGRVLGFYRALIADPAEVQWTSEHKGYVTVVVRPASAGPSQKGAQDVTA